VLCADPQTAFTGEEARDYDPNWHLCIETSLLHAEGWSDPPGSKWARYLRPVDCFEVNPKPSRARADRPRMQVARFVLDSAVLPLAQETLPVGEAARWALMGIYGRLTEERDAAKRRSPVFSGKDASGQPLEGHRHAYYLPTDQDGDGRLDHLTVVAEGGFGPVELKALNCLRTLKRREESPLLNVLLLGMGTLDEFLPLPLKAARIWISATPFVVTRHPKRNGQKRDPSDVLASRALFVQRVVKEELDRFCERRHLPWSSDAIQIEPLTDENGVFRVVPSEWTGPQATGPMLRPLQFKRFRHRRDDDGGVRPAGTFRVTFPEPVRGPVSLGHSSHFGLGLFVPARQP